MVIRFTCPNGHRLSSPDNTVGRSGKCPQCGEIFKVPAQSTVSGKGSDTKVPSPNEEIIEFLCPNGHHLEGPARLAGRGGQCPHCGTRFQIPTLEEIAASAELPDDDHEVEEVEEVEPAEESAEAEMAEAEVVEAPPSFDFIEPAGAPDQPEMQVRFDHPMARLFEGIWDGSEPEAVVEVYLTDGKVLAPQHYAHSLSRGKHAVFGTMEPDNTQTLTVVSWELVSRVVVRGLREMPEGMFD